MERLTLGQTRPPVRAGTPPGTSPVAGLKLAELVGALSHALDLTEGQPRGHGVRCCWIGMHLGRAMGLDAQALRDLYYTLLLKDLGCSSNAARICELYLTDDRSFKHDFKTVGDRLPQMLQFVFRHTGVRQGVAGLDRLRAVFNILRHGGEIAQELIHTRCHRGADIARQLRFSEAVAQGILSLDEHWDGGGKPEGLGGESIPLASRIALLAQVVDVFSTASSPAQALREAQARSGSWFDPQLVRRLEQLASLPEFWLALTDPALDARVLALEPALHRVPLDDDYLDDIATAFGQVIDAKSPYTSGHSGRVAVYTDAVAQRLGLPAARRRWLRRGAALHDLGKLGVSNAILDKPGKLDAGEWEQMRQHALHTETILSRIAPFAELARVSGAHHERLDGGGYPRGLKAEAIALETRIITVADIFDALSADRPYRAAMPAEQALTVMRGMVGTALDPLCFEALAQAVNEPVAVTSATAPADAPAATLAASATARNGEAVAV